MKNRLKQWLSALLAVCLLFSVTTPTAFAADGTAYDLSLDISNPTPALGDSVTITASFTVDGTVQDTVPDGCTLSIWYQNDSEWVTPVDGSSTTTSTNITLDSSLFTAGKTYAVEAALYDAGWNQLAFTNVDFTVAGEQHQHQRHRRTEQHHHDGERLHRGHVLRRSVLHRVLCGGDCG